MFGFSRHAYRHAHTATGCLSTGFVFGYAVCCLHLIINWPCIERIIAAAADDTVTHFAQHSYEVPEPYRPATCVGISRFEYLRAYHICINSGGGSDGGAAPARARRYIGISHATDCFSFHSLELFALARTLLTLAVPNHRSIKNE